MKGYCVFDNVQLKDIEKLNAYKDKVGAVVAKYEGKYLILGGQIRPVEGKWSPQTLVVIEFPSYAKACEWYDSEDYRDLKALRMAGVDCNAVIVEGTAFGLTE